ncbi:hypothetical protein OKW96_13260 [Sphingobacterium sp. KU25419]|nr:hypothetical protein OKW96_13260 [Sphingobacterium sp. KU25419]
MQKFLEEFENNILVTREINRLFFQQNFIFKECQFTYIVKSEGRRMIGDSLDTFTSDELTFIESNLPHVWHNDSQDLNINHAASSKALYFEPDKLISTLSLFLTHPNSSSSLPSLREG